MTGGYAPLGTVQYLTIHCAATPEGRHVGTKEISAWDIAKFGQISYHAVIEIDGKLTRTLRDDQKGAHVGKHNTGNLGLCYIGGLDAKGIKAKDTRTIGQRESMKKQVLEWISLYPVLKQPGRIRGHRDWSPDLDGDGIIEPFEWVKSCPCFDVQDWLRLIGVIE